MDYLFSEYGGVILEAVASAFIMVYTLNLFVIVMTSGAGVSYESPIIFKTIHLFIQSLIGSV